MVVKVIICVYFTAIKILCGSNGSYVRPQIAQEAEVQW